MRSEERARSIISSLEQRQQEIQQRFEEEQRRLQQVLERKQQQLEDKQLQIQGRLEREQERLLTRLSDSLGTSLIDREGRQGEELSGRERILQQARDLFISRGFLDVSMREIAEAAGLRKATIYHHFRDKEELFIAVTLQGMAELQAAMRASVFGKTGLPARLEELAFTQLSMSRGTGMRLAQDFRDHIPESRHAEMHAALEEVLALYRSVFEDAAAAGELADIDPALAASGFFHIMNSWMWDFPGAVPTHEQDPRTLAQAAVRLLLYGVASADLRSRS